MFLKILIFCVCSHVFIKELEHAPAVSTNDLVEHLQVTCSQDKSLIPTVVNKKKNAITNELEDVDSKTTSICSLQGIFEAAKNNEVLSSMIVKAFITKYIGPTFIYNACPTLSCNNKKLEFVARSSSYFCKNCSQSNDGNNVAYNFQVSY